MTAVYRHRQNSRVYGCTGSQACRKESTAGFFLLTLLFYGTLDWWELYNCADGITSTVCRALTPFD